MRNRLIVLLAKSPVPDNTGSRRRILRLIEAAQAGFDVRIVIVSPTELSPIDVSALRRLRDGGVDIVCVDAVPASNRSQRQTGWTPSAWRNVDVAAVRTSVAAEVRRYSPSAVWFSSQILADVLAPGGRISGDLSVPIAVDAAHSERQAIDSQIRSDLRRLHREPRRLRRVLFLAGSRRHRIAAEARAFSTAALVTACSDREVAVAQRVSTGRTALVLNGVDLPKLVGRPQRSNRILFVGNLHYAPNVDAVRILVDEVLPEVHRTHAGATVSVVGPGAEAVEYLGQRPGVVMEGFVDDLSSVYASAEIVVAPISSGSGTKIKVLEAMSYGLPVVTTVEGVAGLDIVPGVHALLGANPAELADCARRLFDEPESGVVIGRSGRDWVEAHATWRIIGEEFVAELLKLANGK